MKINLYKGTQVLYVPTHAEGDLDHPDVQVGFVARTPAITSDSVFVRYWNTKGDDLRTKANSESTPIENLVVFNTYPQSKINSFIKKYGI